MKRKLYLLMTVSLFSLGISQIHAQVTGETGFWLTFGQNLNRIYSDVDLQIRIVGGSQQTNGTIRFTGLEDSVSFSIAPQQVFTYNLSGAEKQSAYNTAMGVSNRSIYITTDYSVTVYALNQALATADATNVLPVTALGTDYYQISYTPYGNRLDAYAVIATTNNTAVRHNGSLVATLNTGQVYYRTSSSDMTGAHITADKPVAFFALNQGTLIPGGIQYTDCLMQQLAPVNIWGRNFFVPVSHLTKDIVRIVASENNTNITQTGGTLLFPSGGQSKLTNLQAGQFVELEVSLKNDGCYIQADKPVGVCAYLTSMTYNYLQLSDPAQSWLLPINRAVPEALIAPFIPNGDTYLNTHYALVITPTDTKDATKVSIGGSSPAALSDGVWIDNDTAGMSFYTMPLTNKTASYRFTNDEGLIIMCYGVGSIESYYYLAYFAMRDPTVAFYANEVHYQKLTEHVFCMPDVDFRAEVSKLNPSPGSLKWYIDGIEEIAAQDKLEWSKNFPAGEYEIKMWVRFVDDNETAITGTLNIGALISASVSPPEGGSIVGTGCYKVNDQVELVAIPNACYDFINWTIDGVAVSASRQYEFKAEKDVTLVANFSMLDFDSYAAIVCNRVILLNRKKLADEGYEVTGCKWYKNGIEVTETHTIDEFSFSEGPDKSLETEPTFYTYRLITTNHGELCSTKKIITLYHKSADCPDIENSNNLLAYPNPVSSGSLLTIEGVVEGSPLYVYNYLGACVLSTIAGDDVVTLTLDLPPGIYLIRSEDRIVKILIVL